MKPPRTQPRTGLELITENRILLLLWRAYTQRLTPAGQWLIAPTVLFGMWGSTSLDNQIHVACLYALAVWAVAVLSLPIARPRVTLTARHADRLSAGQTLPVEIIATPKGRRTPGDVFVMPHRLPPGVESAQPQGTPVPQAGKDQTATVALNLRCPRRGVYELRGWRVSSDFPFGLLNAYQIFWERRRLLVYPQFTPLNRLQIAPGQRYQPGGVALASNLGESLEFIGSRPFREGDSVRDIDWTATARLDQVIVREYRQEYFHRVAIILDTFLPSAAPGARREDFERAVSIAAAISDAMARQEFLVDLFAAGPDIYHLSAGRSLAYVDEILEILACVEPSGGAPFASLEPEIDEGLAQITTIVCVFLDWDDARRRFTQRLARDGAALKVVVVRDDAPTLDPRREGAWGPVRTVSRADWERGVREL